MNSIYFIISVIFAENRIFLGSINYDIWTEKASLSRGKSSILFRVERTFKQFVSKIHILCSLEIWISNMFLRSKMLYSLYCMPQYAVLPNVEFQTLPADTKRIRNRIQIQNFISYHILINFLIYLIILIWMFKRIRFRTYLKRGSDPTSSKIRFCNPSLN